MEMWISGGGVVVPCGETMVAMSSGTDAQQFLEMLGGSFAHDEGNGAPPVRYSYVTAPPIQDGAAGVPEIVVAFLIATDGAQLYCSDDEKLKEWGIKLKEWGIPPHAALLYDREEIEYWTNDLRDQLVAELASWRDEGGVSPQRASELIDEVGRYWVIGATVNGDSFVVESATAATFGSGLTRRFSRRSSPRRTIPKRRESTDLSASWPGSKRESNSSQREHPRIVDRVEHSRVGSTDRRCRDGRPVRLVT